MKTPLMHFSNKSAYAPLCAFFAVAACHEPIQVGVPPPPQSYMVCEEMPAAPNLAPLEAFVTPEGVAVYRKAETDARDASIARYIVAMRGAWFSCSNQLAKIRDYYEAAE